ncbi:ATPase [Pectobacterium punjabense]|uniref:ATPase n=1 Tax=Pectobacterium punjabense TaxID=2108399 RepID=A0ABX6L0F5_9GAMM|nr:AAA family ATPase [Pectobacterium punjabense]MBS4432349.1 AAA family ATPase [Pectobacterium punjabense]PTA63612.1 ATPase [Pectobacterium punjabense]QJA19771.1 ATPase [Pectobacterium punjabense]
MTNIQQRIVLTGGPGSGKSTLIDALTQRGYTCSTEAGRAIIQDQLAIGGNALPWGDRAAFAEMMLCWEMRSYHHLDDGNTPCFFDRGLPDIAGYLSLCELPIPMHLEEALRQCRYFEHVFIAPPWREIYAQDTERKQSFEEAVLTYQVMLDTYQKYGYQLWELPRVSVDERVSFIISKMHSMVLI